MPDSLTNELDLRPAPAGRRGRRVPPRRLPAHHAAGRVPRRAPRRAGPGARRPSCSSSPTATRSSSACASGPSTRAAPTTPRTPSATGRTSTCARPRRCRDLPRARPAGRGRRPGQHRRGRRAHRRRPRPRAASGRSRLPPEPWRSARPASTRRRDELRALLAPGLLTAESLDAVQAAVAPGITTGELDAIAERTIRDGGGVPNFMLVPGYRNTICASVNADVVHGIPGDRRLEPGRHRLGRQRCRVRGLERRQRPDLSCSTTPSRPELVTERRAAQRGHRAGRSGTASPRWPRHGTSTRSATPSRTTSSRAATSASSRTTSGHGIGRSMHEEPPVFNYRVKGRGPAVKPGPRGGHRAHDHPGRHRHAHAGRRLDRHHGRRLGAAHWEHSVAVHEGGIWVLTAHDGGAVGPGPARDPAGPDQLTRASGGGSARQGAARPGLRGRGGAGRLSRTTTRPSRSTRPPSGP